MTKYLAVISLLSIPLLVYLTFGWLGIAALIIFLISYAVFDFIQFRKKDRWQNSPYMSVLRSFAKWNFSFRKAFGENGLDAKEVIPENISRNRKAESERILAAYDQLLLDFKNAAESFDNAMNLKKGSGVSSDEILLFIGELEGCVQKLKIEHSAEYSQAKSRERFFEETIASLKIGLDGRGEHIWGSPIPIHSGVRFFDQIGLIDVLFVIGSKSEKPAIFVGDERIGVDAFEQSEMKKITNQIHQIVRKRFRKSN